MENIIEEQRAENVGNAEALRREDESARTEYSKQYVNERTGMRTAVLFSSPVHYSDGKSMQEIDSGLTETTDADGEQVFENTHSSFRVRIGKSTGRKKLVDITEGKYSISMTPTSTAVLGKNGKATRAKSKVTARCEEVSEAAMIGREKSKSKPHGVRFDRALGSSDLEYRVESNRIKENIVVNEKSEIYEYNFKLEMSELEARACTDGSVELYDPQTSEAKFTIPAPYMLDADGNKSDEVKYTLRGKNGAYTIKITADSAWINADDRAMPVTIDPQIILSGSNTVTVSVERRTRTTAPNTGAVSFGVWKPYTCDYICVGVDTGYEYRSTVTVKLNEINLLKKLVNDATLLLSPVGTYSGYLRVDGDIKSYSTVGGKFLINVTSKITQTTNEISIFLEPNTGKLMKFTTKTDYPIMEIDYKSSKAAKVCYRELPLTENAKCMIDVATGEMATEIYSTSTDGLSLNYDITHVHKQSISRYNCGNNFRLNLHERLGTDSYGKNRTCYEKFYYLNNQNNRVYVEKSSVSVNPDGTMFDVNKHDIYREVATDTGARATLRLNGVVGSAYLVQRRSEIQQLDEEVEQYWNTLKDVVIFNPNNGNEYRKFSENTYTTTAMYDFISSVGNGDLVMTESEANSLIALKNQIEMVARQEDSYSTQRSAMELSKTALQIQYDDAGLNATKLKNNLKAQISNLTEQQTDNFNMQNICSKQLDLLRDQYNILVSKSSAYLQQFKRYFTVYRKKDAELKKLNRLVPVSYIMDGDLIKGFNSESKLVTISDVNGNAIAIEYDPDGRIMRIFDDNEREMTFTYNASGNLMFITDAHGRRTEYSYSGYDLSSITYPDGRKVTIAYSDSCISELTSPDKMKAELSYTGSFLTGVNRSSTVNNIAHNSVTSGTVVLSNVGIEYGNKKTVITTTTDITEKQTYVYNDDGNITEYYVERDNKVVQAEKYDYVIFTRDYTYYAKKDLLNKLPLSAFTFTADEYSKITLNALNKPTAKMTEYVTVDIDDVTGKSTRQKTQAAYTYDRYGRIKKERTTITTDKRGTVTTQVAVKEYFYNAQGNISRTESYIESEVETVGKNIEEIEYDEKGRAVKKYMFNSLDPASKLCTEAEFGERGSVVARYDATGENKTKFEYAEGSNSVRTETLPNGGKISYGYDINGNVAAITQSTEDGEENSTQTEYTCGEVTKLTSGDNTIKFEYDGKHRKKAVYINSETPYVSYTYSDKITEDGQVVNKVTSTYVNGDNIETVSDLYGNIIKVTYNDEMQISNTYDAHSRLIKRVDGVTNKTSNFTYDSIDRMTKYTDGATEEMFTYNTDGKIASRIINVDDTPLCSYSYEYKSNAVKDLESITCGKIKIVPKKDILGRNTGKEIFFAGKKIAEENIYYRKVGDHATNMPVSMRFGSKRYGKYIISDRLQYKYDECGNITEIHNNGTLQARYTYDKLNRLVREDNRDFGKTWLYSYDNNGNILIKREMSFTSGQIDESGASDISTIQFATYEGDIMTPEKSPFVYNKLGNPTKYLGNSLTWTKRKQLAKYGDVTFEYDGQGKRIKKNDMSFTYDGDGRLISQSNGLKFVYDNNGVIGFIYSNTTFFYQKDVQGNIIAILDSDGIDVVRYTYDAWGNHQVRVANSIYEVLSQLNPFLYRGYYYDSETELYYLNSRYYDPRIGRFISADDLDYLDPNTVNGLNLYAYCGNNPVMNVDPSGTFAITALFLLIVMGGGAVIGGAYNGLKAHKQGQSGWGIFGAFMSGAIMGGAMSGILAIGGAVGAAAVLGTTATLGGITLTTSLALGASAIIGAAAGMVSYSLENGLRTDRTWNTGEMFLNGLSGFAKGLGTFGVGFAAGYNGAFDKLFLKEIFTDKVGINFGRAVLTAIFKTPARNFITSAISAVGDFLAKFLFVSSAAVGVRKLIDILFGGIGS